MKSKWNIDPTKATTIARLLSELEGISYILDCLDQSEDLNKIEVMKKKYYDEYFRRKKEEKVPINNTISGVL